MSQLIKYSSTESIPLSFELAITSFTTSSNSLSNFLESEDLIDIDAVHEAHWYEYYPMFLIVVLATFFGIFPHYLMDPIAVASYDILDFMGVL